LTGTIWWAIIAQQQVERAAGLETLPTTLPALKTPLAEDSPLKQEEEDLSLFELDDAYLDLGRRYQLRSVEVTEFENVGNTPLRPIFQGTVVDCQPLQKSLFQVLLEEKVSQLQNSTADSETALSLWQKLELPELAFPYYQLQQFSPVVPEVHDAWQQGNQQVILLPDRSHWQSLSTVWAEKEDLTPWQIGATLNQMATLWKALIPLGCCQSLLIESNLRLDQTYGLALQQLYPDPETSPTLQDLARFWQHLLKDQSLSEPLVQLLEQLASGEVASLSQLRLQLQDLLGDKPPDSDWENQENPLITKPERPLCGASEGEDLSTAVMPMQLSSLTDAGYTDPGRQRLQNEDYFALKSNIKKEQNNRSRKVMARGLYIVCDGMGGHASGEVASKMAVETLRRYFKTHWKDQLPDSDTIEQGILLANQTIYRQNQNKASSGSGRMGTTVVLVLLQDTQIAIAHVGDSRIYRVNREGLKQLTVDHEVGQREIKNGVDPKIAYARSDAYQLTQALGPHDDPFVRPEISFLDLYEDTLLLLCSDGLSDNRLIENYWQTYLKPLLASDSDLERGLEKLIEFSNQYNGHDNITAILVRIALRP
jgi:protein phosphatase